MKENCYHAGNINSGTISELSCHDLSAVTAGKKSMKISTNRRLKLSVIPTIVKNSVLGFLFVYGCFANR